MSKILALILRLKYGYRFFLSLLTLDILNQKPPSLLPISVFKRRTSKPKRIERIMQQTEGLSLRIPCNHTISKPAPRYRWTTVMCPSSGSIRGCKPEKPEYLSEERLQSGRISVLGDGECWRKLGAFVLIGCKV